MAVNEIHLGDIGTVFEITVMDGSVVVDISTATTTEFVFEKPSNATVTQTAVFVTDGTDGELEYTTVADDLDEVGSWRLQVYIVMPSWTGRSDIGSFEVHKNLPTS